jgi:UDP-2,3-diacylglucosamine hydrolase
VNSQATLAQASAGWRTVEFASDFHLCQEAPKTCEAFGHWLQQSTADALFILGDLFEVWIGDDTCEQPFQRACLTQMAQAALRRPMFFICGNRDFLMGQRSFELSGLTPLPDPFRMDVCGHKLLLSHGDALCLSDTSYQNFRRMVRSETWQRQFLALSMSERASIAQRIRTESQGRKAALPDVNQWADVDNDEACRWLVSQGADTLVHGHTHRPGRTALGPELDRRVLPDWDFDTDTPRGYALRLDCDGWTTTGPTPSA